MQLKLPLFPSGCTLISDCLGVYEKEGFVQYIVNGLPVYAHPSGDLKAFRYITSNFIHQGLCRKTEVERCFHISEDSVQRAYKKFVEKGEAGFFIKMICYRAETAVANELAASLYNAKDEKRMLVKQIIQNNADLLPDYVNKTLTVVLHTLSAPRFNQAAAKLAGLLNQTETIFPGTDLQLKFEISALSNCEK